MESIPDGLQHEPKSELELIKEINESLERISGSIAEVSPVVDKIKKGPNPGEKLAELQKITDELAAFLKDFNK